MASRHNEPQAEAPQQCERCGEPIAPRKRRRSAALCRVCTAKASQAFLQKALVDRSHHRVV